MIRIGDLDQLVFFKQLTSLIAAQTKYSTRERDRVFLLLSELITDYEVALEQDTPLSRYASRLNYRPIDLDLLSSVLTSPTLSFSFEEYSNFGLYSKRLDRLELIRQIRSSPVIHTPVAELDLECERGEPFRITFSVSDYDEESFVSEVVVLSGILAGEGWTPEAQKRNDLLADLFRDRLRKGYTGPWVFEEALLIAMVKANESRYLHGAYTDTALARTILRSAFDSLVAKGVLKDDPDWIQFERQVSLFA